MTSTAQYKCMDCKGLFTARTADRARGWARFCSKSCKARKQMQKRPTNQARQHLSDEEMNEAALHDATAGWDDHKDWI